jgi:hypothetical protein
MDKLQDLYGLNMTLLIDISMTRIGHLQYHVTVT